MAQRPGGKKTSKGKKGRKYGRNERYSLKRLASGWDLRNRKRRARRHVNKHPNDQSASSYLDKLRAEPQQRT